MILQARLCNVTLNDSSSFFFLILPFAIIISFIFIFKRIASQRCNNVTVNSHRHSSFSLSARGAIFRVGAEMHFTQTEVSLRCLEVGDIRSFSLLDSSIVTRAAQWYSRFLELIQLKLHFSFIRRTFGYASVFCCLISRASIIIIHIIAPIRHIARYNILYSSTSEIPITNLTKIFEISLRYRRKFDYFWRQKWHPTGSTKRNMGRG